MKKLVVCLIGVCVLLLSGCGNSEKLQQKYEDSMKEFGTHYYENFGVKQMDVFHVTIADLKKANDKEYSNYDLDKLKDCEDDSKITFTIDKEDNGKIIDTTFQMNCKK